MSATLVDTREKLIAKQKEADEIFAEAKTADGYDFTKVARLEGDQKGRVEQVQALMSELKELGESADEYAAIAAQEEQVKHLGEMLNGKQRSTSEALHPSLGALARLGNVAPGKSLAELFVESDAFKGFVKGGNADSAAFGADLAKDMGNGDMLSGVKTLMTSANGIVPEAIRSGRIVESAVRPIQVIDMIPGESIDSNMVVYQVETAYTNVAAETAEGGTFPEAELALTDKTSPVRKITVWIPVTDEQLEDVSYARSYIDNRLGFMIRQRLDGQIVAGPGSGVNLEGINARTGVQVQANSGAGADDWLDDVRRMKTKVRTVGRSVANALFASPNDLEAAALLKTTDGIYILSNPNDDSGLDRLWGLRVVEVDVQTDGRPTVGDTTQTGLAIKRNVTIQISNSHGTQFVEGKQAVRADMRVALQVYRPAAFVRRAA